MEPLDKRKIISYDMVDKFFRNNINSYMAMAEGASESTKPEIKSVCDSIFINQLNSNTITKDICRTLLVYFHLSKLPGGSNDPNIYCGFSNYWLNKKVRKENGTLEEYASNFFNIFASSTNENFTGIECKNYIYNMGDETYKKMNILFTYYSDYNNFLINKMIKPNISCIHALKCANIYKQNIINCSTFEEEFCKKLKTFRDILMNHLVSSRMCANEQAIIFSTDAAVAESSSQNPGEKSSQATTISVTSFGTAMGVSLLSLFLYKVTPLGSWLSPRIGNLKKTLNIGDNKENESLFQYSESTESNYTNGDYSIAYHFVGNS
ncbi:PIR Superfamily Protein [Plasmodium ovale curtisi]|uniref:PIR Superfamily Protein n=1 Tax=Plasmodium ovale curtisi TaxID=864141 RepID=A0A1A8WPD3_PLAOA|nr:PIR Superfamily Protein [Plasmodium ovale curtisi]